VREYNGVINLNEPFDDYSIYKMYSSDNKDLSIYIGVTRCYKQRAYRHSVNVNKKRNCNSPLYMWMDTVINCQNNKVMFELIEEKLSEKDAFDKEVEYIKHYKNLGYNVLNLSEGGKGHKGNIPWNKGKKEVYSQEQLNNLSKSHTGLTSGMKGKNHSQTSKNLISLRNKERSEKGWSNPRKKRVYKYTSDNLLVKQYFSLMDAATQESVSPTSVGEWCRKEKKPKNGFIYSYSELN
jgi:hypothetical protein